MQSHKETFKDYILHDVFSGIENICAKAMFGGYGLYYQNIMFGIITDEEMYFRADDSNKNQFESRGGYQFIYTGHKNKKPVKMPWWRVPEEILEDSNLVEQWMYQAYEMSLHHKK